MCDKQSLRSAYSYAQSDQSLCLLLEYSMNVKLLTEHPLKLLSLKGGYTGSSESTHVKMPHCWESHVTAHYGLCHKILVLVINCQNPPLNAHPDISIGARGLKFGLSCLV